MLVSVVWWDGAHVFDRFTGIFLYPTTLWSNRPVNELEFTKRKCFWTVKIARQDCGVSSAGVDWLIAACHSNLSSTLIMEMAKWMKEPMAYSVPTKHSSLTELTLIWLYFWTALLSEFSSSLVSTSNFSLNRLNQAKEGKQWKSKLTHYFHQRCTSQAVQFWFHNRHILV